LRFTPPGENRRTGEESTVWILKDNQPEGITIKKGLSDDQHTQILSGNLQPGQEILTNIKRD